MPVVVSAQSGDVLHKVKEHKDSIADLQNSKDRSMFITASKDNAARVRSLLFHRDFHYNCLVVTLAI